MKPAEVELLATLSVQPQFSLYVAYLQNKRAIIYDQMMAENEPHRSARFKGAVALLDSLLLDIKKSRDAVEGKR